MEHKGEKTMEELATEQVVDVVEKEPVDPLDTYMQEDVDAIVAGEDKQEQDLADELRADNEQEAQGEEAQEEVKQEPVEPEPTASEKFKMLKEQDKLKRQTELKVREVQHRYKQLEEQTKTIYGELQNYKNAMAAIQQNPLAALQQMGYTQDMIIEQLASGEYQAPQQQQGDPRVEMLEQELRSFKQQAIQQKEQQEIAGVYNQFAKACSEVVSSNPEAYEMITETPRALELVHDTAEAYYNQYGQVPELKEVIDHVEQHLVNQEAQRLERLKNKKKLNSFFTPTQQQTQERSTLKPSLTPNSGVSQPSPKKIEDLSEEELLQYTLSQLKED
jgi:hypothetical protein